MSEAVSPVHVFKFGGTSVATAERIRAVVDLVRAEPEGVRRVVVVSALGGVTDQLVQGIDEALARTGKHRVLIEALRARHEETLRALAPRGERGQLREELSQRWLELTELLDGVSLLRECTLRTRDAIIGMGERAAAPLVAAAFRAAGVEAASLDATTLIRTDANFGEANVVFDVTGEMVRARFGKIPAGQISVVTGFIASTDRGVTTTLGRSGSDYTATILGAALDAERVVIWTDVDGVLSADPRLVRDAFSLPQLSYREAAELAYFGAKVLHPRTMRPLEKQGIPLYIKNTLNPSAAGTLITTEATAGYVKAVTTIRALAVVMLEGAGMIGVPGIAARAFGALAAEQINVLLISQASSEQSICIVVRDAEREAAVAALEAAFELERARGDVSGVVGIPKVAIASVVGDNMRYRPGLAGRMFSTLGRSGVNVIAIAEGASETNISAVIAEGDVIRAVRSLHEAFPLSRQQAHLFLIGTGTIGTMLLGMLAEQEATLRERLNLNLQLIGLANSRRLAWDADDLIPFDDAKTHLEEHGRETDLGAVVKHLVESRLERLIVIDATASDAVAHRYPELLEHDIAIVTPNKRANTQDQAFYDRLREAARDHQVPYRYETTVGAGLPVISTLRDLLRSGDRLLRVEGVLSGTMGYLFNALAAGTPFSEAVRAARDEGYTEPDPRDDLQGEDVARKLLILAREAGMKVEREDVAVESLVPPALMDASVEAFMDGLDAFNDEWDARVQQAAREGGRLHYVGLIEDGRLSVRVRTLAADSPFAALKGTDNMIAFTTERYRANPLVIQGPGAGPAVTAAGILVDVIHAAELVV